MQNNRNVVIIIQFISLFQFELYKYIVMNLLVFSTLSYPCRIKKIKKCPIVLNSFVFGVFYFILY